MRCAARRARVAGDPGGRDDEPEGTRRPLVATAAARHGLDVILASTLRHGSFAETIRKLDVELLFNVHSLSVLGWDILRPHIGSFNLQPGPLPEYACLNALSRAIYEGRRCML